LALGGPACIAGPADRDNADAFFELLDEMDDGGHLDTAALARRVEDLRAIPDPNADDGLQILSIHKAKGLEFDVVIVPGLGRTARADESRLMLWLERPRLGATAELLMAPIHATGADSDRTYDYLKLIEARKSEYEMGRLLYVAATRAKSELHLLGHTQFETKDDGAMELKQPGSNSLLQRLWTFAEPLFQTASAANVPDAVATQPERKPQSIERLAADWRLPAMPPSVAASQTAPSFGDAATGVSFRWVGDTLRHIGTVVHQMLRRIAEDGCPAWNSDRIQAQRPAYSAALLSLGVPASDLAESAGRVASALALTVADGRGRWLLDGGHAGAACEYALSGIVAGELVNARIDRTFIDEHDTRWIIDYKSSSHGGSGVEAFLDNERERYRGQLERYRDLFAALEDRPVRMGLYFPLLGGWREVEADGSTISAV